MEENIEVDCEELDKQIKEEIIKKGEFVRCEVVIGGIHSKEDFENSEPLVRVQMKRVGTVEVALLINCLESVIDSLEDEFIQKGHYRDLKETVKFIRSNTESKKIDATKEAKDE